MPSYSLHELRETAAEYRSTTILPEGGFVIIHSGKPIGWIPKLENNTPLDRDCYAVGLPEDPVYVTSKNRHYEHFAYWTYANTWPQPEQGDHNLAEIAVHPNSSIKAEWYFQMAIDHLDSRQLRIDTLRAFMAKFGTILAGLSWEIDIYDVKISVHGDIYRGERTTPKEVSLLFGENTRWKRAVPAHNIDKDTVRDWITTTDGVQIRILKAEVFKPVVVTPPWEENSDAEDNDA